MLINELDNNNLYKNFLPTDVNGRTVNIYRLKDIRLVGQNLFYPNCLLHQINENIVFNPVNEKIMSLDSVSSNNTITLDDVKTDIEINTPVFYFVYNTDNYYHFIYDTLPYLITYLDLKKEKLNLKLLMNYPNSGSYNFYPFVREFLELLGISDNDILIVNNHTVYNEIYISSSYTHGIDSNLPPRKEIYDFYRKLALDIKYGNEYVKTPKKIYISRRSWIHNDFSNIGTNYTTRRKLENEDTLVESLNQQGYVEVFTENLSTIEKIRMFSQVDSVIGSIGGGMCNVLFSPETTDVVVLLSPTFLDVNKRFTYSFSNVNVKYFNDTKHVSDDEFKKYMRVKVGNIVGEITEVYSNEVLINYSEKFVAGWNSEVKFSTKKVKKENCIILDKGLNSEWTLNIEKLLKTI
jgi:hypothetical protein